MKLCFNQESEYVDDSNYWCVELSNGKTIYEDKIPKEESTWHRLRKYLENNDDIKIQKICLYFHDKSVIISDGYDGFCFSKSEIGFLGMSSLTRSGIGFLKDNQMHMKWITPDEIIEEILPYYENDPRVITCK